jgi:nucleoside-diphosphate-sugar epimerase
METEHHVLLLGATGRTGGHVLTQLLERGLPVRVVVRSADRLPAAAVGSPLLTVVTADLSELTAPQWQGLLEGCDTVISCLGHRTNPRGIFGPPRDLLRRAVRNVAAAVAASPRTSPVRLILMTSVSVNQPDHADTRRGFGQRAFLRVLGALIPPTRDNQRAADHLARELGSDDPGLQWVVVRPDTLTEGDVSGYAVHDGIVASLFRPDHTRMANVAHFMCELTTDTQAWQRRRGGMPVIVDAEDSPAGPPS